MNKPKKTGKAEKQPGTIIKMTNRTAKNRAVSRHFAKLEKNRKKVLTKGGRSGILTKLSGTTGREARAFEVDLKRIRKKYLTNGKRCVKIAKLNSAAADAS